MFDPPKWPCTFSNHAMQFQANSEVSALLGRIPSAVGYQPTLATDLGGLQERITTNKKGSITSVQVSKDACQNLIFLPTIICGCLLVDSAAWPESKFRHDRPSTFLLTI